MGDKIGIIGVNGTGKSTLLRDIARGEAGDGGRITANGQLRDRISAAES